GGQAGSGENHDVAAAQQVDDLGELLVGSGRGDRHGVNSASGAGGDRLRRLLLPRPRRPVRLATVGDSWRQLARDVEKPRAYVLFVAQFVDNSLDRGRPRGGTPRQDRDESASRAVVRPKIATGLR